MILGENGAGALEFPAFSNFLEDCPLIWVEGLSGVMELAADMSIGVPFTRQMICVTKLFP